MIFVCVAVRACTVTWFLSAAFNRVSIASAVSAAYSSTTTVWFSFCGANPASCAVCLDLRTSLKASPKSVLKLSHVFKRY